MSTAGSPDQAPDPTSHLTHPMGSTHLMTTTGAPTRATASDHPDLAAIADNFSRSSRSPVLGSPADHGLAYENVTFPAEDGTPLEGWFVPRQGAACTVVVNHPRWFSRSGLPGAEEPWRSAFAETRNDINVDLIRDLAILHEAGYHVLAYDLRNCGLSGAANGGVTSSGNLESRDVVGSLRYARTRPDTRDTHLALFSRCLGANATLFAMQRVPEEFTDVRCLIACQPLSPGLVLRRMFQRRGIDPARMPELDRMIELRTGFTLDDMSPISAARSVRVPTLMYQVRDDVMTEPTDVQAMYDAAPNETPKSLYWIEGSTRRWDGYLDFQRHPDRALHWLSEHTGRW